MSVSAIKKVLTFWFSVKPNYQLWYGGSPELDLQIKNDFEPLYDQLASTKAPFDQSNEGILASIIVLDQFSRNMYRGTPKAFELDPFAVELSLQVKDIWDYDASEKSFSLMPLLHSEDLSIHAISLEYFEKLKNKYPTPEHEKTYQYAIDHYKIVKRFGHYPHRNVILGRESSQEEIDFLKEPGSSF